MTPPITLDESITTSRPLREVFAYISEFNSIEEWDPAVASAEKLSTGATGVGTEFRINMRGGVSLLYTVLEFEPDQRVLMSVKSKLFTAEEEIRFSKNASGKHPSGTKVRYIAKFNFPKPVAQINKTFPWILNRVGKATMTGMKRALENNAPAPTASKLLAAADKLLLPGIWRFTSLGYKEAKRRWKPDSEYLGDKHIVITGPTSGIGEAMAMQLAARGAKLTLVARNKAKAADVASNIILATGNPNIVVEVADLSIMAEVHALAARLLTKGEAVDVLINNAGALFNPREETSEGLEKSFALLLLGPYILTESLLPALKQAGHARVVNILSGGMYAAKIKPLDLQYKRGDYSGSRAYARAKRGLMIATEDWASRWASDGIVVNAMHPGWADTPGVQDSLPDFYKLTARLLRTPEQGADTAVWLAAASQAGKASGKFWLDREQHPSHLSKKTVESKGQRQELFAALEKLMQETRPTTRSPATRTKAKAPRKKAAKKKASA